MQNVSAALNEQRQACSGGTNTVSILPEHKPAKFDREQEDSSRREFDCDGERLWQCDGGMVWSVFMVRGRDSSKHSSDFCHHYGFQSWKSWVLNQVKNKKKPTKNPEGIQHTTDSNPHCGPKRADTDHLYNHAMKKIINDYHFASAVLISPSSTRRRIYFLSQTWSNCLPVSPPLLCICSRGQTK